MHTGEVVHEHVPHAHVDEHVSVPYVLQACVAFGAQAPCPPHVPATHMLDELHVSVSVPQLPHATVRVVPGVHTPVHAPARHWYWHAVPFVHCPLELHVCGVLPEHCAAPGLHTPVHAPLAHTYWQETGLPH